MNRQEWRGRIVEACRQAGTYARQYDNVIDTLAQILEDRDKVREQYESTGAHPTIIHTNKAKEQNIVKNPMLVMEMDLNAAALAYWRDLGLTPRGFKALGAMDERQNKAGASLEKLLSGLSNG